MYKAVIFFTDHEISLEEIRAIGDDLGIYAEVRDDFPSGVVFTPTNEMYWQVSRINEIDGSDPDLSFVIGDLNPKFKLYMVISELVLREVKPFLVSLLEKFGGNLVFTRDEKAFDASTIHEMSTDLFYEFLWVINHSDIAYLHDTVFENPLKLDYQIAIRQEGYIKLAKSGFNLLSIIIRVPTRNALDTFIEKVGKQMGLVHWNYSTEDQFLKGTDPVERGDDIPPLIPRRVTISEYGSSNEWIKETQADNPSLRDI